MTAVRCTCAVKCLNICKDDHVQVSHLSCVSKQRSLSFVNVAQEGKVCTCDEVFSSASIFVRIVCKSCTCFVENFCIFKHIVMLSSLYSRKLQRNRRTECEIPTYRSARSSVRSSG
jgi:hypothetical protein